jgi:hypothetical protein
MEMMRVNCEGEERSIISFAKTNAKKERKRANSVKSRSRPRKRLQDDNTPRMVFELGAAGGLAKQPEIAIRVAQRGHENPRSKKATIKH